MATVQTDSSEESMNVQYGVSHDKITKKNIILGVLAITATVAVIYTIINNSKNSSK